MQAQSGTREIKTGDFLINRGRGRDRSPGAGKTFCFQNDPALAKPQGGH